MAEGGMPVEARKATVEALAEAVGRALPDPAWVEALYQLAADDSPLVRRAVAGLLPDLPDTAFAPLAAKLADDPNQYVRDTLSTAHERRKEG